MELSKKIAQLLGDFSHLEHRIQHISFDTTNCGERINVRCSYPSFRDGEPTIRELIETVHDHIIAYCLPRSQILNAQKDTTSADYVKASRIWAALSSKANELFIKAQQGSTRSGEAGEIILYILTEWILQAPQIVSKMYLKTNNNMPVHGTDGIHARFDAKDQTLYLYWGESKAHKTLASALDDALKSIQEFVEGNQEEREIDIVSNYLDFGDIDNCSKEAFLKYLDPYEPDSQKRNTVFSCLLIHECPATQQGSNEEIETEYVNLIKANTIKFINKIHQRIDNKNLSMKRFEFFLFPVPSVTEMRDRFQEKIGWPKC